MERYHHYRGLNKSSFGALAVFAGGADPDEGAGAGAALPPRRRLRRHIRPGKLSSSVFITGDRPPSQSSSSWVSYCPTVVECVYIITL
jgi:hypothetical protein